MSNPKIKFVVTPPPDADVENSDASYTDTVASGGLLILPDQTIEVNTINEGSIPSVGTIEIDITDGVNPVTPNDVTIVGRKVTVEVPTSTPPSTGTFLVRFFDIDGTILKEERRNAGQDATAPPNPNYDPTYLVFAEWNQPFTNVQNDIDVGAIYDTIDGKTYLFVRITDTTGLQPTLALNKSTTDLMTIDWGDATTNTTSSSGNLTITKTAAYSTIGDYLVTIECAGAHSVNTSTGYLLGNNTTYSRTLLKMFMGANFLTSATSFANHTSLNIVSISKTSSVATNILSACYSLTHINIPTPFTSFINTFNNCQSLKSLTIPNGLTSITTSFLNCYSLRYINLKNVTTLGTDAFKNCTSLERVILNNSLTTIGGDAFATNSSLREINIPTSLITLSQGAFQVCTSLVSLDFPSTLTSIGSFNFSSCFSILEYTFLSTTPPTLANTNAFTNINAACKIYVPDASVAAYKAATNWSTYANYIYPLSTKP